MASNQTGVLLSDLLYELAIDGNDPALLRRFMDDHPEHAAALNQYAKDFAEDGDSDPDVDDVDEERILRLVTPAMSRYQNRLFDQSNSAPAKALSAPRSEAKGAEDPFAALDKNALRALAQRLDVNFLFFSRLRDREIKPETIPSQFLARVSEVMGVPISVLVAHQSRQAQVSSSLRHRSERKPSVGAQQSWDEAIGSSSLTEEQQTKLRQF